MRKTTSSPKVKRAAKGEERRTGDSSNDWRDGMRVIRLMILKPTKAEQVIWRRVATELQRIHNRVSHEWKSMHLAQGNDAKMRKWLEERSAYAGKSQVCFKRLWDDWKKKHPDLADAKKSPSKQAQGKRAAQKKRINVKVIKEIGKAPLCPVKCWGDPPKSKRGEKDRKSGVVQLGIYATVRKIYTEAHANPWSQSWASWTKNFAKRKADNKYNNQVPGWAKHWHMYLADLDGPVKYAHASGVPMHPGLFTIIPPQSEEVEVLFQEKLVKWLKNPANAALEEGLELKAAMQELQVFARADGVWHIGFRAQRAEDGAAGEYHCVRLATQGRGRSDLRFTLEAIAEGSRKQKGSAIYEKKPGKWYFHLGYNELKMARAKVDENKEVILEPGITVPWLLKLDDEEKWIMDKGGAVKNFRRILAFKRKTFSASYQYGSKRRGHGNRARKPPFRNTMDGFKDDFNKKTARKVLEWAIARGCGKIVYRRPVSDWACKVTFLATAGAEPGGDSSWPWERISLFLTRLCEEYGLEFVEENYSPPKKKCEKCGEEKVVVRFPLDFAREDNRQPVCCLCEDKETAALRETAGLPIGMKGIPDGGRKKKPRRRAASRRG